MSKNITNVFTIDVEDWFHILDLEQGIDRADWSRQESRVERNTERLLDLLRQHRTHATCFVLGWIAEHYPALVKTLDAEGHEIAAHGYAHELIYERGPEDLRSDLQRSIELLGTIVGRPPLGYRAPGFSITKDCLWAFSIMADLGLKYDSSVFPAPRGHGGLEDGCPRPHRIQIDDARWLVELPMSTTRVCGRRVAYCGGGYLRLFPLTLIRAAIRKANSQGVPVILYIHPRDIDPDQPRIAMPLGRRVKSYVGLRTTYDKLNALLGEFPFDRADRVIESLDLEAAPVVRLAATRPCSPDHCEASEI